MAEIHVYKKIKTLIYMTAMPQKSKIRLINELFICNKIRSKASAQATYEPAISINRDL